MYETKKILVCNHEAFAEIISSIVKKEIKKNNDENIVFVKSFLNQVEFISSRLIDPTDLKMYKYYDFARGAHAGLIYGL